MNTSTARELWLSQRDALTDLSTFIAEHGPDTGRPLPLLHWSVGPSSTVHAQIHAFDREHGGGHRDPRAVISAFADALGVAIMEHPAEDAVMLIARGRIGPPEEDDDDGRTLVVISARVPPKGRHERGGHAFLP